MRIKGLEPSLLSELEPKSSASANSAISALVYYHTIRNSLWEGGVGGVGGVGGAEGQRSKGAKEQKNNNAQCPIPNAQFPMPNAQCPMPNYMTAIRGRRCLNPQRISHEIVFSCSAQSSAEICSFPCSPSKVTTSPSWILGMALTSSIN